MAVTSTTTFPPSRFMTVVSGVKCHPMVWCLMRLCHPLMCHLMSLYEVVS